MMSLWAARPGFAGPEEEIESPFVWDVLLVVGAEKELKICFVLLKVLICSLGGERDC